jgi:DNA-binding NarL/FixJ family response regulator
MDAMKKETKIKVMLVDDHALLREGIALMLSNVDDIDVVGSASSGEEAINEVAALNPDVILMDIMLKGMTGIEATKWIKEQYPDVKVILLSMEVSKQFVTAGIQSGIDGYCRRMLNEKDLSRQSVLFTTVTKHLMRRSQA